MKTFKVQSVRSRYGSEPSISTFEGTIPQLVEQFSYTLECGKSWEHEKGNKKINTNPKGIKSLINNLNNAVNNSAANGYSNTSYREV